MRRLSLLAIVALLLLLALPVQAAGTPNFTVPEFPPKEMRVGDPFTLRMHVPQQAGRWLVSLELIDPVTHDRGDFGGWVTSRRQRLVDPANGDIDVTWEGQAGAPGRFRLFVHATPADAATSEGWTSPGFDLAVQPAPAPNSSPMLGVAIGEPLFVGILGLWLMRRRRVQRAQTLRTGDQA